jgi:hypothetical protein
MSVEESVEIATEAIMKSLSRHELSDAEKEEISRIDAPQEEPADLQPDGITLAGLLAVAICRSGASGNLASALPPIKLASSRG